MTPLSSFHTAAPRRQRGAVAVTAAVAIIALITSALLVIEIGRVYQAQRSLQKMASIAALDAVRVGCGTPTSQLALETAVTDSITRNGNRAALSTVKVEAGKIVSSTTTNLRYLQTTPFDEADAVRVTLTKPFPSLLTPFLDRNGGVMQASATAQQGARGRVMLGSTLASVGAGNQGLLNSLLSGLLGGSVNLTALAYQGLAGVNLSLGQLAPALGVTVQDLSNPAALTVQTVILGDVLDNLAGSLGSTVSSQVSGSLQQLAGEANVNTPIPLGTILNPVGQIATNVPFVNLGDLIMSLALASHANANPSLAQPIQLPSNGLNISIPGVITASTYLKVIEPPKLSALVRPSTTSPAVTTAQVQLQVRLQTESVVNGALTGLNATLDGLLLLTKVVTLGLVKSQVVILQNPIKIGIDVGVGKAAAYLDELQCPNLNNATPIAHLSAKTDVVTLDVGTYTGNAGAGAAPALSPTNNLQILTVGIDGCISGSSSPRYATGGFCPSPNFLGLPLDLGWTRTALALGFTNVGAGAVSRTPSPPYQVTQFTAVPKADLPAGLNQPYWKANNPGTNNPKTVGGSSNQLSLHADLITTNTGAGLTGVLTGLVTTLLNVVLGLLNQIVGLVNNLLTALINPLLQLLGVQAGSATITMDVVTVGQPYIVTTEIPLTTPTP